MSKLLLYSVVGFVVGIIAVLVITGKTVPERIEETKAELAAAAANKIASTAKPVTVTAPTPTPAPPRPEDNPLLEKVRARLIDSQSARFKNLVLDPNGGICGEFNAKNRMGGYGGFEPFFVTQDTVCLFSEYKELIDFYPAGVALYLSRADEAWMRGCVCQVTPELCQ